MTRKGSGCRRPRMPCCGEQGERQDLVLFRAPILLNIAPIRTTSADGMYCQLSYLDVCSDEGAEKVD